MLHNLRASKTRLIQALLIAGLNVLCLPVAAQQKALYKNPVIPGDFPDPSVIRVGEDYWAMTTTGTWAPHFPILHSRDLVNWRIVGYVFQQKPPWVKSDFWAPEIIHDRGRFLVYYTARRDDGARKVGTLCVAVATAPAPAGPYNDHGPLVCQIPELKNVGSIDAFFIRDEQNRPYLVWKADGNDAEPDQPTSIFAQRLSKTGPSLLVSAAKYYVTPKLGRSTSPKALSFCAGMDGCITFTPATPAAAAVATTRLGWRARASCWARGRKAKTIRSLTTTRTGSVPVTAALSRRPMGGIFSFTTPTADVVTHSVSGARRCSTKCIGTRTGGP